MRNGNVSTALLAAVLVMAGCNRQVHAEVKDFNDITPPTVAAGKASASQDKIVSQLKLYRDAKPSTPLPPQKLPASFGARLVDSHKLFKGAKLDNLEGARNSALSLTEEVQLKTTPVKDQGDRGTCTAFSAVAAIEALALAQNAEMDLSEEALWARYQEPNGPMSVVAMQGAALPSEDNWPYNGNNAGGPGLARAASVSAIGGAQVVQALNAGHPVLIHLTINASWTSPVNGVINTNAAEAVGDTGHAVLLVGATSDYLIFKNSWNSTWGDNGFGYIDYNYCSTWSCSFYEVSSVTGPIDESGGGGGGNDNSGGGGNDNGGGGGNDNGGGGGVVVVPVSDGTCLVQTEWNDLKTCLQLQQLTGGVPPENIEQCNGLLNRYNTYLACAGVSAANPAAKCVSLKEVLQNYGKVISAKATPEQAAYLERIKARGGICPVK